MMANALATGLFLLISVVQPAQAKTSPTLLSEEEHQAALEKLRTAFTSYHGAMEPPTEFDIQNVVHLLKARLNRSAEHHRSLAISAEHKRQRTARKLMFASFPKHKDTEKEDTEKEDTEKEDTEKEDTEKKECNEIPSECLACSNFAYCVNAPNDACANAPAVCQESNKCVKYFRCRPGTEDLVLNPRSFGSFVDNVGDFAMNAQNTVASAVSNACGSECTAVINREVSAAQQAWVDGTEQIIDAAGQVVDLVVATVDQIKSAVLIGWQNFQDFLVKIRDAFLDWLTSGIPCSQLNVNDVVGILTTMLPANPVEMWEKMADVATQLNAGFAQSLIDGSVKARSELCGITWYWLMVHHRHLGTLAAGLQTIRYKCPKLFGGSDANPAINVGIDLGLALNGGLSQYSASAGIGMDVSGNMYCWVQGCQGEGLSFPPDPVSGEVGVGMTVAGHAGVFPGTTNFMSFSLDVNIPGMVSAGGSFTFEYPTSIDSLNAVTVAMSFSRGSTPSPIGIGINQGQCYTPICMYAYPRLFASYENRQRGYWNGGNNGNAHATECGCIPDMFWDYQCIQNPGKAPNMLHDEYTRMPANFFKPCTWVGRDANCGALPMSSGTACR